MLHLIKSLIEKITLKIKINKIIIGVNKEERTIEIKNENPLYNYNIPIPPETILNSSSEEVGSFIRQMTYLNVKSALKDRPKEMEEFLLKYGPSLLSTTASTVTVQAFAKGDLEQTIKSEHFSGPMPSGDFVAELARMVNMNAPTDFINVKEDVNLEVVNAEQTSQAKPNVGKGKAVRFIKKEWKWIIGTVLVLIGLFIPLYLNQKRPYLSIELVSRYLIQDDKGNSTLLYRIRNKDKTAYYRKGHMIFELSDTNSRKCKPYYEGENKIDVLQPEEVSAIHGDDIGKFDEQKSYKGQLVISYGDSKERYGKRFLAWANLEFQPAKINNKGHIILQKSLGAGLAAEKQIRESIYHCQEFQ